MAKRKAEVHENKASNEETEYIIRSKVTERRVSTGYLCTCVYSSFIRNS